MGREVRTEKRGTNPFLVIVIFLAGAALIGSVLFTIKVVDPTLLPQVFGSPDAQRNAALTSQNQDLLTQNGNLTSALGDTQTENGQLRAALASERANHWIPVLVIVGVIIIAALLLWMYLRSRSNPELDIDAAIAYEEPRARQKYGFPRDYFSMAKPTWRAFERLKHQGGNDTNEYMYFIEFQFHRVGKQNLYWHGITGSPSHTVTVALTSKTYRYREQWFDWMKIKQAIKEAHESELWGFSLQKTKLDEDFLSVVENARSFNEVQREYATTDDVGSDS